MSPAFPFSLAAFLLPITALVGAFAVVIVAMVLKNRAKERRQRERMYFAEKGLEVPKELFDKEEEPVEGKPSEFKGGRAWLLILGSVLVFIGLGVMIAVGAREGIHEGINGIIPMLIGVSFFVAERLIARMVARNGA
jgi:hypothetical protein